MSQHAFAGTVIIFTITLGASVAAGMQLPHAPRQHKKPQQLATGHEFAISVAACPLEQLSLLPPLSPKHLVQHPSQQEPQHVPQQEHLLPHSKKPLQQSAFCIG